MNFTIVVRYRPIERYSKSTLFNPLYHFYDIKKDRHPLNGIHFYF